MKIHCFLLITSKLTLPTKVYFCRGGSHVSSQSSNRDLTTAAYAHNEIRESERNRAKNKKRNDKKLA